MVHYKTFNNNGNLIEKTTPDETELMVVSVFGNAEKISSFNKDNRRIWDCEPFNLDVDNYKGFYKVPNERFEEWCNLIETCRSAEERMEAFKHGHD